ncbi:MAG: ABC-three component system middle component 6 [Prevotella sp.]
MILPTKGISPERSLLGIGGDVLGILKHPMSVSEVWTIYKRQTNRRRRDFVSFDWFILALDLLYAIGAVSLSSNGRLVKNAIS